jgi:hypothetical protein
MKNGSCAMSSDEQIAEKSGHGLMKMALQMQRSLEDSALLTPEQAAEMMGITPKTLREWNNNHRHRQVLSPIRFTHKHVRYERKRVLAFIEKCRTQY